jgi:hypothetical protein
MYTIDETGVLNNYATEPQVYFANYPSSEQQKRYMFQAGLSTLLVTAALFISFSVS